MATLLGGISKEEGREGETRGESMCGCRLRIRIVYVTCTMCASCSYVESEINAVVMLVTAAFS